MQLLENIKRYAQESPERIAVRNDSCQETILTYEALEHFSDMLAAYIYQNVPKDKSPIIVYGNKNPYMLVIFLACIKTAHPYCPIDTTTPQERMADMIEMIQPHIVFATEPLQNDFLQIIPLEEIVQICNEQKDKKIASVIQGEDIFYILFTSGSTGKPKGVEITAGCIDRFLQWSEAMVRPYQDDDFIFLNQSPFSFDLSVMDVYTSLYTGGTLYIIDDTIQDKFKRVLQAMEQSGAVVWVSTPSLVDMCLMSKKFSQNLLPRLKMLFFCGEVLSNTTAKLLMERFPNADIINAYGPTEATVAVTSQLITKDLVEDENALPVGKPKPNCSIEIWRTDGTLAEMNETGEIVIKGDTVGRGYFGQPELTEKAFVPYFRDQVQRHAYKTGDQGYLDGDGVLHFGGRSDMQLQLHGYRIELSDIEQNLLRLGMVSGAAVIPKLDDNDKLRRLAAFVVVTPDTAETNDEQKARQMIKGALKQRLPEYMIPSKIIFLSELPRNQNGKIDRKKLQMLV